MCLVLARAVVVAGLFLASITPASAGAVKLTSLYNISLGAPLAKAIHSLEAAGFTLEADEAGSPIFHDERADLIEGAPVILRSLLATRGNVLMSVQALRLPGAAEDAWRVHMMGRTQTYDAEATRPLRREIIAGTYALLGVSQSSCQITGHGAIAEVIFADATWAPIEGRTGAHDSFCRGATPVPGAGIDRIISLSGFPSGEDDARLSDFSIDLLDGAAMRTMSALLDGSYVESTASMNND